MSLQSFVFNRITGDAAMNSLGWVAANMYPAQTVDSIPADQMLFGIIQLQERTPWLLGQRGANRSYLQHVEVYLYTRAKDWAPITTALKRLAAMCDEIVAESTGSGWVIEAAWRGETEDQYDEVYEAMCRVASLEFVANGE